jgi:WhiB family redox-sensing transcriptional regulator
MRFYENPDRNCADKDRELWFPERQNQRETHAAKRLCDGCPVKDDCLADAMRYEAGLGKGSREGIYGGTTPAERYALEVKKRGRKPRRPVAHGTDAGYKQHQRRDEVACSPCVTAHRDAARLRAERRRAKEAAA